MSTQSKAGDSKKWLLIALAISFTLAILFQLSTLRDPQVIDEDFRFNYWLHRISDPQLFVNDPIYGRQMAALEIGNKTLVVNKVSPLYSLIFVIATTWLDPILIGKLLVFPLILATGWFLFKVGRQIMPPFKSLVLCIIFALLVLLPHSEMSLTSGLQRSFNLLIILALLYALELQEWRFQIIPILLGLVYPPMFVLVVTTLGLHFLLPALKQWRIPSARREILILLAAALLGLIVLLPGARTGQTVLPESSGRFTTTTVFNSPMFGQDGRYPLLTPFPIYSLGGFVDNSLLGFYTLFLLGAALTCWLILRRDAVKLPQPFWTVFWAAAICYVLSWLPLLLTTSPLLHFPSRYPRGILFLMGLIYVVANGPLTLQRTSLALSRSARPFVWLVPLAGLVATLILYSRHRFGLVTIASAVLTVTLVLLALIRNWQRVEKTIANRSERPQLVIVTALLILLPQLFILPVLHARLHKPSPSMNAVLQYLQKLPQASLIAGDPCSLNDVPLYAKRTILFSCEAENPSLDLMFDFYTAYYASEMDRVTNFCQRQGIDYLVVNEANFTDEYLQRGHFWYEPIDSAVAEMLANRNEFALAHVPDSNKLFQADHLFVMACAEDGSIAQDIQVLRQPGSLQYIGRS